MEKLDELVNTLNAEKAKAQSYLDQDLITRAEFDILVANATRSFLRNKAELFATGGLTSIQGGTGSFSSSSTGANATFSAPSPPGPMQGQSRAMSNAVPAPPASTTPETERRANRRRREDDGGQSEGKRQRRPLLRYQVGDGSTSQTSEFQRSDRERREAKVKEDLHQYAMDYLPDSWKCKKGKGAFLDRTVVVHPDGQGYNLRDNPVEGVDFFATAQAAMNAFIKGELVKHTRMGDVEKVVATVETLCSYLQDQHAIQQPQPVPRSEGQAVKRSRPSSLQSPPPGSSSSAQRTPARASGSSSSSAAQHVGAPPRRRANSSDDGEPLHSVESTPARSAGRQGSQSRVVVAEDESSSSGEGSSDESSEASSADSDEDSDSD